MHCSDVLDGIKNHTLAHRNGDTHYRPYESIFMYVRVEIHIIKKITTTYERPFAHTHTTYGMKQVNKLARIHKP